MKFPVDLLADVSQAELERLAQEYANSLLYRNPDTPECLTLSDSTQVTINVSRVGFAPLYGRSDKSRILVLFSPTDPLVAVAVYLLDRWWTVEDILKTADPARHGVLPVDTVGERIVLYVLNRVIYRVKEKSSEEIPFLCHGENDLSKILWDDGEAVGFYSAKAKGSLYNRFSSRTYQLPVMDSIFVRKCHRGKGSGLLMLKDFVFSFGEDSLGLKYPLSNPMYRVCEKYLSQCPEDSDLLWEVERSGGPNQRTNIASKVQVLDLSAVSKRLSFTEESQVIGDVSKASITKRINKATEYTEEIVEETTVLRTTKVKDGRLDGSALQENITEDRSEKVIRIEHVVAEAPREEQVSIHQETETHDLQTEGLYNSNEAGEVTNNSSPVAEEAVSLSHRDLSSRDSLEVSPATEEPQDETTQDELATSRDPPEEAKEDPTMPVVSHEVFQVHTEVETLTEQGRILRSTTVLSTIERSSTQQRADEETEEEGGFSKGGAAELGGDVIMEEKQWQEDEEVENEEQTEKKGTVPQEISAEHPDVVELEERHVSDHQSDEAEEPPVVQPRGHRGRRKANPKPKSTTQGQHEDEGKHTPEAELKAGRSPGGTEAADKQTEEENREEKAPSNDRTLAETSTAEFLLVLEDGRTEGAEESEGDVITSPEVRIEIKEADRETAPEMVSEKEDLADDGTSMGLKTDVITADDLDQPAVSVPDGLDLTKDCELPRLQHASVILVDLKTNSNYLSVMVARETSEAPCFASEAGEVELIAAETMDQTPELASTEELDELKEVTGKGQEESPHQNNEEEEEEEEEEAPVIQTINLRSGRKIVKVGHQDQEHEEDHEAEIVPDETEEEKEPIRNDGAMAEEKEPTEDASTQPDVNEEMRLEEDEAPTNLQPLTEANETEISGEETEAEKATAVSPEADEGPVTLAEDQENTADSTLPEPVQASNPEEAFGAPEEKQHNEDVAPQDSDLQRVTVVLVELRSSSQSQDETRVVDSNVAEEQPPAETEAQDSEEDEQPEAAQDAPGKVSDVSEEAVPPTLLSGEDSEAEGGSGVEEEVPVVESRVLRSGRKTRYTTVPRKGRRSAAATPRGKPRRGHANCETEEQAAETLEEQREEPKPDLEDATQKDPSKELEVKEGVGAAQEETLHPHLEEAEEPGRDEPIIIARSLRKAKRSAPATPRRRSKRSRLQPKSEEGSSAEDRDTGETMTDDGEISEIENGDKTVDHQEDMDVVAAESTTVVDPETHPNGAGEISLTVVVTNDEEEEEAPAVTATASVVETSSGPEEPERNEVPEGEEEEAEAEEEKVEKLADTESAEPENIDDEPPAEAPEAGAQVDGTETEVESPTAAPEEEAPAVTSRSRRSKTRTSQTTPAPTSTQQDKLEEIQQQVEDIGDEETQVEPEGPEETTRPSSTEEDTDEDLPRRKEEGPEEEAAEDDTGSSEVEEMGGPSGFTRAEELEVSDGKETTESDVEDEKESDSEEEEDVSGDDIETVVMGKKVLRGRTVPALIISPRPKARRSKGLLSDGERSPPSARKEKLKRKRSELTPARKPKRRSRVQL